MKHQTEVKGDIMSGNWKLITNVKITAFDLDGNIKDVTHIKNLITTAGKNMLRDALHAVADIANCEIKYVEVGTGSKPPALTDTTLQTFLYRKAISNTDKPADGQTWCMAYILPAEAIGALKEIGWWAGAAAGAAQATGILFSRVLYSRNKTALETLQIERTDAITEI